MRTVQAQQRYAAMADPRALARVAAPDSVEADAAKPDEDRMKTHPSSPPDTQTPAPEPQAESTAVVLRPLRPATAARSYEQLAFARVQGGRSGQRLAPARDPLAYPTAPPRLEGAVKRIYNVEPEAPATPAPNSAPDPRHRAPLSLRSASLRSGSGSLQRAHGLRAEMPARAGQKSGEDT